MPAVLLMLSRLLSVKRLAKTLSALFARILGAMITHYPGRTAAVVKPAQDGFLPLPQPLDLSSQLFHLSLCFQSTLDGVRPALTGFGDKAHVLGGPVLTTRTWIANDTYAPHRLFLIYLHAVWTARLRKCDPWPRRRFLTQFQVSQQVAHLTHASSSSPASINSPSFSMYQVSGLICSPSTLVALTAAII